MDKETARAINDWIADGTKGIRGDNSEWARGYRRALQGFKRVVALAKSGDIDAIRDIDR